MFKKKWYLASRVPANLTIPQTIVDQCAHWILVSLFLLSWKGACMRINTTFFLYMRLGSGLISYEGKVGLIGRGDPVTSNIEVSPGRIRRMDVPLHRLTFLRTVTWYFLNASFLGSEIGVIRTSASNQRHLETILSVANCLLSRNHDHTPFPS